jgi:Predicted pyridoxal phosphate-dependent enzyme apparently involved in regulation of cell wall biogenesis
MRKVYYGKAVYDNKEIKAVNRVLRNNNLNLVDGPHVKNLEKIVPKIFGKKFGLMVNSGSSANLFKIKFFSILKGEVK